MLKRKFDSLIDDKEEELRICSSPVPLKWGNVNNEDTILSQLITIISDKIDLNLQQIIANLSTISGIDLISLANQSDFDLHLIGQPNKISLRQLIPQLTDNNSQLIKLIIRIVTVWIGLDIRKFIDNGLSLHDLFTIILERKGINLYQLFHQIPTLSTTKLNVNLARLAAESNFNLGKLVNKINVTDSQLIRRIDGKNAVISNFEDFEQELEVEWKTDRERFRIINGQLVSIILKKIMNDCQQISLLTVVGLDNRLSIMRISVNFNDWRKLVRNDDLLTFVECLKTDFEYKKFPTKKEKGFFIFFFKKFFIQWQLKEEKCLKRLYQNFLIEMKKSGKINKTKFELEHQLSEMIHLTYQNICMITCFCRTKLNQLSMEMIESDILSFNLFETIKPESIFIGIDDYISLKILLPEIFQSNFNLKELFLQIYKVEVNSEKSFSFDLFKDLVGDLDEFRSSVEEDFNLYMEMIVKNN